MQAMKELKIKHCECSDRIPQRIFADGIVILHFHFARLFELIYTITNLTPKQETGWPTDQTNQSRPHPISQTIINISLM